MFQILSEERSSAMMSDRNAEPFRDHLKYLPNPDPAKLSRAKRWLTEKLRRGEREQFCEKAELTPELASLLLSINTDNRKLIESAVCGFAADISADRFPCNGENLVVCSDWVLGTGQHRSHAVIRAGRSINVFIAFGIAPEYRSTMDGGNAKRAHDHLQREGFSNTTCLAAAAQKVLQIERFGKLATGADRKPTKQEVMEFCRQSSALRRSISVTNGSSKIVNATTLAAAHFFLSKRDAAAADAFVKKLLSGAELSERDPIFTLRDKLRDRRLRLTGNEQLKAIFMAWNNWRRNKRAKSLTHSIEKGEKLPEAL